MSFPEDGSEWRLPGILYAANLVLRGVSEEDLRVMVDGLLRCVVVED